MPTKYTKRARTIDSIDKLFEEVDAEVLFAGVLGAVAVAGGIVPPFTRILSVMGGSDASMDVQKVIDHGPIAGLVGTPEDVWNFLMGTKDPAKFDPLMNQQYALMASGMMEGMLMMNFAKNPEALKLLGDALGSLKVLPKV